MANYAVVKDNTIIELRDYVPVNWENITNFNVYANDEEQLKQFGWYKIVKRIPVYDKKIQKLSSPRYSLDNNIVYEDYDVIQVIASREEYNTKLQNDVLEQARKIRNKLLAESDWTQIPDVQESKTVEWINAWKAYRKQLRDITIQLKLDPKTSIENVQFPAAPE